MMRSNTDSFSPANAVFSCFVILAVGMASRAYAQGPSDVEQSAEQCTALSDLRLSNTTVVSAMLVEKPASTLNSPSFADLPAFCRVVVRIQAAPDSEVRVEVWLPSRGWNGVFHGNGNGGFAGTLGVGYGSMAEGVRRGFATAITDTGTSPATPLDGDALIGHPRKWKDWGRLSTHAMTLTGKAIAESFYQRKVNRSYFTGCSTGGQQGLIEALYYPHDYDGILVGAPVINRTWGHAAVVWDYASAHQSPGNFLSDSKLRVLNSAATASCNKRGYGIVGDPFITDPLACRFDPAEIACHGAETGECLTAAELATARAFYSGPTARDGRPLFFGWPAGSEAPARFGWSFLQTAANGEPQFAGLFKWVFGPNWDWHDFRVSKMAVVDATLGPDVNDATRGSLRAFAAHGGKLIMYHGLADSLVPPAQSVAFYEHQARALGGPAKFMESARLFMAPGVEHCGGGAGPDAFNSALGGLPPPPGKDKSDDLFSALIAWTGAQDDPERVIATKFVIGKIGEVDFQRPLCAYPEVPRYNGVGATKRAEDFVCQAKVSRSRPGT
jgi:hypothetical protein